MLLAVFAAPAAAMAASALVEFGIYRDDKRVGTHTVRRQHEGDLTTIEVQSRIRVTLLGLVLYAFAYDAVETWDNDGIVRLKASVDDDGKRLELEGERHGNSFNWSANGVHQSHPMPLYPTNHWNAGILQQDRVLNTLTGKINEVAIAPLGTQAMTDGDAPARVYRYDGQLRLDSWYRDDGEWIGMRFRTARGDTIDYRCLTCKQVSIP